EFAAAVGAELATLSPPEDETRGAPPRPVPVLRIICPACGKKLKVPPEAEGRILMCPKCGSRIEAAEGPSWLQRPLFRGVGVVALGVVRRDGGGGGCEGAGGVPRWGGGCDGGGGDGAGGGAAGRGGGGGGDARRGGVDPPRGRKGAARRGPRAAVGRRRTG